MSLKWKRLNLSNQENIPPLLFRYTSTSNGYGLYITDLTNIWSEHLTRQDILRRADEQNTPIDPSEDTEQFKVLLQKIGDALRGQSGTTANLGSGSRGDSLELILLTKLPAPLQPLKWNARLLKEPHSAATKQLLLPLIQAEADWELCQRSLIDQLHKKDWILGKLFDKIEDVGIDLSTIFPGISGLRTGPKGATLEQAAKHIKGIAPFDENAWLKELNAPSAGIGVAANILEETSSSKSTNRSGALIPPPDQWWEKVIATKSTTGPTREESEPKRGREPSNISLEADTDTAAETEDDGFERQETPPRLKQPKGTEESPSSSEGNEEIERSSTSKSPLPSKQKSPTKPSKGLGIIGGKKPTKELQSSSLSPSMRTQPTADDETDSGSEHESSALALLLPVKAKQRASENVQSKPRGLGIIGGKKKERQATFGESTSLPKVKSPSVQTEKDRPSPQASPSPEIRTKRAGKLGVIGGKTSKYDVGCTPVHRSEESSAGLSEETLKHSSKPTMPPLPESREPKLPEQPKREETDQERADRKREELKRQLEAKSKAPVRKKRKF
ncbi:hypothetical protein ETB97_003115 [Aspergillus alliaceus]|uniref:Non-homologous end-joining factor 1 n=1 Tax=Petromyces alliaceus TaxID=209559 RepID=A0A8H6E4L0_PETAA|nr:hypothetical protein ETB97_003115 [Aspergillus burnettii]